MGREEEEEEKEEAPPGEEKVIRGQAQMSASEGTYMSFITPGRDLGEE